jgi:membrane protein YdbS with pleckstrin-like domain
MVEVILLSRKPETECQNQVGHPMAVPSASARSATAEHRVLISSSLGMHPALCAVSAPVRVWLRTCTVVSTSLVGALECFRALRRNLEREGGMAVPVDNRIETPNLQPDLFTANHLIVGPGASPDSAIGVSSQPTASNTLPADGASGMEAEETIWEGRYSARNFLGRTVLAAVVSLAWLALAITTWGFGFSSLAVIAYVTGVAVVAYWLSLGFKFFRVRRNHHYRLTTRRLFLTTGILQRRVDQVELVRIKDLFLRQSLLGSWLNVGTLILISSEETLPKAHLLGVEEPQRLRDLIWNHSRLERDRRTSEVNPV